MCSRDVPHGPLELFALVSPQIDGSRQRNVELTSVPSLFPLPVPTIFIHTYRIHPRHLRPRSAQRVHEQLAQRRAAVEAERDVDVRRPLSVDVWRRACAALVQGGVVDGGGRDERRRERGQFSRAGIKMSPPSS